MIASIWRTAHLLFAIISAIFLVITSVTGFILAGNMVVEKTSQPYKVDNLSEITLSQSIPKLKETYPEITEITVDHHQFVTLDGFDEDGEVVNAIIDPNDGKVLGKPLKESEFMKNITSLHRSLFLHETGRFIIGISAFLLFLIAFSGTILIMKRQRGITRFFSKIHKDFFSQYFHISAGRLFLIPILIISLSGTYLFAKRFKLIPEQKEKTTQQDAKNTENQVNIADFEIFKTTKFSDVKSIQFPFMEDDSEESFILKLKDKELEINAFSGEITKETHYPFSVLLSNLSLDLHTGSTNLWWAVVLCIAALNILVFIYTGFVITVRRFSSTIKNKYKANDAEYILLVGSENGTTLGFANKIQQQLLASGKRVFVSYLNNYQSFAKAKHLLVFTSTYGDGVAPSSASKFENLLKQFPQNNEIQYSVIGFGSKNYHHFCGFAKRVDELLNAEKWAIRNTELHTINDRSTEEFVLWTESWGHKNGIALVTSEAYYNPKISGLKMFNVLKNSGLDDSNATFTLQLKSPSSFKSGDILAIYPANDGIERLYSIGKVGGKIQLFVKLHEKGLGSQYLFNLKSDDKIKSRIIKNPSFHFPEKATDVVMIGNGTGIAPFLGMIEESHPKTRKHLYCGFRFVSSQTRELEQASAKYLEQQKLASCKICYSRGEESKYVTNLILEDEEKISNILKNNGFVMLCGSLAMQKSVEEILAKICEKYQLRGLESYRESGNLLTDCY